MNNQACVDRGTWFARYRSRFCSATLKHITRQMLRLGIVVAAVAIVVFQVTTVQAQDVGIVKPYDSANPQQTPPPETVTTGNGIEYNGGPIMPGPHNVYFIWYGNWSANTATAILPDFITGLNGSLYFNTDTTYGDTTDNIANTVTMANQVFDNYSQGTALAGNAVGVAKVVSAALNSGGVPVDVNGIYFVLTSPDVTEGQFCTKYCGYHTHGTFTQGTTHTDIKFAFVGNPATQCPSTSNPNCSFQSLTPNGNEGADAMADVMAHELNETVTDPDLNAWFHTNGAGEVGDLCNFKFGPTFPALNGAQANVVLRGSQFLIQQNWLNANGGLCAMGFNPQSPTALRFVPVTPCRVADTRNPNGPFGGPSMSGGTARAFAIPDGACSIPSTAQAYSLNVTVVPKVLLGFLTTFPCGQTQPFVSTLNSIDGRVKAAAAIVPAGTNGGLCIFVTDDTDVVLDINGYFVPATDASALAYYPVTPCRLVDTRLAPGPLAGPSLKGQAARIFPLLSGSCNIPATAQAYALNFTSVPNGSLGFLTTWPAGQTQPLVSTLNAPTGTVTANAAIVPAGTNGDISVFVTNDSNLVIDINGYFAPPAAGGLSLFNVAPCRALDTRNPAGTPPFNGAVDAHVAASGCGAPTSAQAFVLNATVVPSGLLGFLTLWPQGAAQPFVSTLNAIDGAVTSNMAIVPTADGSISAFGQNPTHLVLDLSGYFAP